MTSLAACPVCAAPRPPSRAGDQPWCCSIACYRTFHGDEVVTERHRRASTVVTSNRAPAERLAMMADSLQSAIDRLQGAAFELEVEGESNRRRKGPVGGGADGPGEPTPGGRS